MKKYICYTYRFINMKKIVTTSLLAIIALTTNAQTIKNKIEQSFNTFLAQPALKNGIATLVVTDTENGKVIYEKNSQIGLPTASTLKVITSTTALDLFGPDYTYKTQMYYTGSIDSLGTLHGDIVIKGVGDPTLGSHRFEQTKEDVILNKWKNAIRTAGIDSIAGRIIADDSFYHGNDVPGGWIWSDMGNYYGAAVSGLNWRENKTGVNFNASTVNQKAPIANITSDISYLQIINNVKTGNKGTGDNVYAYSAPYSEKIIIKGTYGIDLSKTIEISIPDPAYDLAFQLQNYLAQDSIFVGSGITTGQRMMDDGEKIPKKTTDLDLHISPKMSEIVYWFNQKSINLYGESLLKLIGYISGGKTTTAESTNYIQKYWLQKLQIPSNELDLIDGSGLSPQNNITSSAMTKIMQYAVSRNWHPIFLKSLPTYNQMTMKSGTIGGTLGYTGYHQAKDGKKYTFTIIVYNYKTSASNMRQSIFQVLDNLK